MSDVLLHRLFLLLDGLDQLELGAAAVEVVARAVDAEIVVAAQEIGQEPDADLEGDQLAGEGDVGFLGLVRNWPAAER